MGAHSSLSITQSDARSIWKEVVQPDSEPTFLEMERFFDRATDQALYNVCILADGTDEPTSAIMVKYYVERYLEINPAERPSSLTKENQGLRQLLAFRVGGSLLYTDDGELQDNSVLPAIDFKRDSFQEIDRKLRERAVRKLESQRNDPS